MSLFYAAYVNRRMRLFYETYEKESELSRQYYEVYQKSEKLPKIVTKIIMSLLMSIPILTLVLLVFSLTKLYLLLGVPIVLLILSFLIGRYICENYNKKLDGLGKMRKKYQEYMYITENDIRRFRNP